MTKPYNWLKTLQEGKGKELSRKFFIEFTNRDLLTAYFHPEAHKKNSNKCLNKRARENKRIYKRVEYIDRNINRLCQIWEKEGFIEQSRELKIKVPSRWKKPQIKTIHLEIMSLEPIFRFMKEKKGIEFTKEEKSLPLFIFDFKSDEVRKAILIEFPDDDIITATLKFYVKNLILRYNHLLRDINENPDKYNKERLKAEELNNPQTPQGKEMKEFSERLSDKLRKKYKLPEKEVKTIWNIPKVIAYASNRNHSPKDELFIPYLIEIENHKDIVSSIDNKILKALDILPIIS